MRIAVPYIYRCLLFCLVLGWGAQSANGQSQTDFRSWNALELETNLSKKWKLGWTNQFRFDSNITSFDRYISQADISYDFYKNYRIAYGLRYVLKWDNTGSTQGLRSFMRYQWDLSYRYKVKRLKITYRYRYQRQHELGKSRLEGDFPGIDHRLKIKFGYNIRDWKWDPYGSAEMFYHLQQGSYNGVDRYRFVLGSRRNWEDIGSLKIQLAYQVQSRVWRPDMDVILLVGWTKTF